MRVLPHLILFVGIASPLAVCRAQLASFGFHLNPILHTPIPDAPNPFDPQIRLLPAQPGFKYGLQATLTSGRASLEAGLSFVHKKLVLRQTDFSPADLRGRTTRFSVSGLSAEPYFLARYSVIEHDEGLSLYSLQALAGISREYHGMGEPSNGGRSDTIRGGTYEAFSSSTAFAQRVPVWYTVIAGAQVRTVLKGIGLVEYGLAFHFPLQSTGPYRMETTVREAVQGVVAQYRAEYYPHLAYIDFRLRYYFYSFKHGEGRVRYRVYEPAYLPGR